jgi:hypothetical protein
MRHPAGGIARLAFVYGYDGLPEHYQANIAKKFAGNAGLCYICVPL